MIERDNVNDHRPAYLCAACCYPHFPVLSSTIKDSASGSRLWGKVKSEFDVVGLSK